LISPGTERSIEAKRILSRHRSDRSATTNPYEDGAGRLDTAFLNLAYASYVAASLIPGGLKFRLGLVAQSLFFTLWGILTNTWSAVVWNVIFAIVNGVQAYRITRRDAVRLTEEEEACRVALFTDLRRRDFLVLWSMGSERQAKTGWQLLRQGTDHN
jgi:hypothetical protein